MRDIFQLSVKNTFPARPEGITVAHQQKGFTPYFRSFNLN